MNSQQIQKAQKKGESYAHDNQQFFSEEGMTEQEFANAALENYNANAEELGESPLSKEEEADFLFGAKKAFNTKNI